MTPVGKVQDISKYEFEWRIEDYFTLPSEEGLYCDSPLFSFAGEDWYLRMYHNARSIFNTLAWIAVFLNRNSTGPPVNVKFSFGLRTMSGKVDYENKLTYVFEKGKNAYGTWRLLSRLILTEKRAELVPLDTLTVICRLENSVKKHNIDGKEKTLNCSQCKNSFDISSDSSPEQKLLDTSLICPTCADNGSPPRKCVSHECEKTREKATEKLIRDFKNVICDDEHSDVIIKVKDKEFRLHRCILAGRNLYFNSMFKSGMNEKTTGIVTIEDCEPDIFRSFINFVYTGKVDDLSLENVCDIYEVADKYQEDQLKEECLCLINNKMSVENICDFIVLALKYNENEILQNATDLFCNKTKEIIKSVKWQTFMREYPTEANELYIKALDYFGK